MTHAAMPSRSTAFTLSTWWRAAAPIAVLIFLAPVLAELLVGTVHITNLWLLVPEMAVYGTGALIIRCLVRQRHRGWIAILLLGIAFAIALECVILQTSLTPQFFPAGVHSFGWAFGVQWIYLTAMLGFQSVYAIVLPIRLTELLFPGRRQDPWLNQRGLGIATIVFLLSSIGVWLLWSRVGLQRYGPSTYQVPLLYVGLALLVIAALVIGTLNPCSTVRSAQSTQRRAWSPWLVGLIAFLFGLFWFVLIAFPYLDSALLPGLSPLIPIGFGLVWGGLAVLFVRSQSSARGWRDSHRLALIFGAVLASMLGGVLVVVRAAPIDQIGKLVFDLIAIVLFVWFAWRLRHRPPTSK
jgi:hypothetical protein